MREHSAELQVSIGTPGASWLKELVVVVVVFVSVAAVDRPVVIVL